ncbi:MAG TPA: ribonuclease D [Xanthomonadales bacterium]|nr:ribonuclease D [Xanthomonadales bacterium]
MHDWIDSSTGVTALAQACAGERVIGLDTEFMRVRTYWPELALVQVAHSGGVALVDPVAVPDLSALAPLLTAGTPKLVMHSASEDLVALAPVARAPLRGLFDTQVAAAFAGLGAGIGYQRLVGDVLGIAIDKGETRSNWLARPLSTDQLRYAAADVTHLIPLCEALTTKLEARGTLAWCREECLRLAEQAADPAPPRNAHWEFRNGWRWPRERQARLKRLLEWREATAQRVNRPRLWLFDNPTALSLVESPPGDAGALAARLAQQKAFPKRELGNLLELLEEPLAPGEADVEPIPEPLRGEPEREFARLRDAVAARAQALDLPPALLASRRVLEDLARAGAGLASLPGWRGEALSAPG